MASTPIRLCVGRLQGALIVRIFVLVALLTGASATGQVVINEVDYDQPSTDGAEFVELKNAGLVAENLDLYELELVNGSGGGATIYVTVDLPNVNLAPGGYFVICGDAANVANCDLDVSPDTNLIQNGAPDAVGLTLMGSLVDALSYEGSVPGYTEGSGDGLVDNSGVADSGLSRCADGADTDQNNVDFSFQASTPGATNSCPGPTLVVNEIDYDQPGTDTGEFVEILNNGTAGVDLDGISLELVNGTGGGASVYSTIALPAVTLAPGGYFVVCGDAANVANCDLDVSPDSNLIQNGAPDAVALTASGAILDTVSYEGDTGAPYTEGSGSGLEDLGTTGNDGMSISRCVDGFDSDQNNVDLIFTGSTPGASNDCGTPGGGLVINEIDYDQPSTDTAEFIEILNTGSAAVALSAFELQLVNGSGGGASIYNTIALPAVSLAAGDYFVVCGDAAATFDCDLDVSPDSNLVQNGSPDAVALLQAGVIVDTVSYEGNTAPPFTEGSGSGLEDSGATGNDNRGISRFPDGVDTDVNNVDLSPRCITPGGPNATASSSCPDPGPPSLVVNEIDYDQPGSDLAEFVEIKNVGTGAVDLTGIDLVLVNGNGGTVYDTIALTSTSLGAGDYWVVCADATTVANCDQQAISSVQNGAPDAVALQQGSLLIDAVSYEGDTAAPYTEGSGAGLVDSGSTGEDNKGISRFPDGVDTDVNNVDLLSSCITPGAANTSVATACTGTGFVVEIFEIQGAGAASPFDGQTVTTEGNVVTALRPDGFFMETPTSRDDGDLDTSNGIFVFTGGAPPVAVGDLVDVTGPVIEFFDFTEFTAPSTVTVVGSDVVPAPVVFDAFVPSPDPTAPSCAIEFECYEGMQVEIASGVVGESNQRFNPDPIAEVFVTATGARSFREPGVEFPGLNLPPIPTWDGNPEVFELDPDKMGLPNQIIPAGSTFTATGVLGFEFGGYELWPTSLTVNPAPLPDPVRPRADGEFTVGSLNLFRLFDDIDDPPSANANGDVIRDDQVVSTAEYLRRRGKLAVHVLDVLGAPDILAVQEAEKIEVLQDLASDIAALEPGVVYTAYLIEGNDVGTIDIGFLTRETIAVDAVTQFGYTEILTFDGSLLNDRPPLLLEGRCTAGGTDFPVAVLNLHGRSLGGIDDPSSGPRVRQKRLEQAEFAASVVQDLQNLDPDVALAVVGDFNAFEFTDGYVDVVGHIAGDFDPAMSLLSGADLVDPDLTNQVLTVAADDRYSFVFNGNAQVLDHALTSVGLAPHVAGFEFGRGNADAAEDLINDDVTPANLALRASDHDGLVLYVQKVLDEDGDGVPDELDFCAGTEIPEKVPTIGLRPNRWALVDDDTVFDTLGRPMEVFTTTDTAGCSCSQIIDELGLGEGHRKFGCSVGAMRRWVSIVTP